MLYVICQFIKIKEYFKLALFVTHKYDTFYSVLNMHIESFFTASLKQN